MTTPAPLAGQYGPELLIDTALGRAAVGATVTGPAGYTATVDSLGNITINGPASDAAVTFTVNPLTGLDFTFSVPIPLDTSAAITAAQQSAAALPAATATSTFPTVVTAGSNAALARPVGAVQVIWRIDAGLTPANLAPGDLVVRPTATTTQGGTSYTPILADADTTVVFTSGSPNTVTVPPNASVAYPVGTQLVLRQFGAGQTTVVPGSGVTVRAAGGALRLLAQFAEAVLTKIATNEWLLTGQITASVVTPPFVPTDLSGLTVLLRADDITGVTDGTGLQTWTDTSGGGRNATQATSTQRPIYRSTATGVVLPNSKPVLVFDGVDDRLTGTNGLTTATPYTAFVVGASTDLTIDRAVLNVGGKAMRHTPTRWDLNYEGVSGGSGTTTATAGYHVFTNSAPGSTTGVMLVDGVQVSTNVNAAPNGTSLTIGFSPGSNHAWQGPIAEVIVYDRALSTTERKQVEAYLGTKYGITVAP